MFLIILTLQKCYSCDRDQTFATKGCSCPDFLQCMEGIALQ